METTWEHVKKSLQTISFQLDRYSKRELEEKEFLNQIGEELLKICLSVKEETAQYVYSMIENEKNFVKRGKKPGLSGLEDLQSCVEKEILSIKELFNSNHSSEKGKNPS